MDFSLLPGTVLLRPYVFIFLCVYLVGCSLHLGLKRAILFCAAGYLITWVSEYSSIHNGFPYGHYFYIDSTRDIELWVLGVPFMDSLSYVFLAYASYSMAIAFISPSAVINNYLYFFETRKIRNSFSTTVLSAVFLVFLDIIIDPVALRGDKWFLGKLYGYPEGGSYFGVPISNFAGWFLVGIVLVWTLQKIDRRLDSRNSIDYVGHALPWRYMIGPALYLGVVAFNLFVTFYIGEYTLGWTGIFLVLLLSLLFLKLKPKLTPAHPDIALEIHLSDFPRAVPLLKYVGK